MSVKNISENKKISMSTILAFGIVIALVILGFVLDMMDSTNDVFPNNDTQIYLYGEAHGYKRYYDIEFDEWNKYYTEGCRNLFVELPYFSAEFLNEWMKSDSNELLDLFFDEIQGTQSGVQPYYDFLVKIKERCPETIFHGTDVGHQYETTGPRYLAYLEERGLDNSEQYILAEENIRQGIEFKADDNDNNGKSSIRENYMVSNFIDAYERCGGGKIMGIYGSYHTNLYMDELMGGKLRAHYGDIISSVKLSTLAFDQTNRPYRIGFSYMGVIFLLMLFIPNIIWARKGMPVGYEESAVSENKVLLMFERVGQALVSVEVVIFPAINLRMMILPDGIYFNWKCIIAITALVLMILYECYWIKYFKSPRTMDDFYSSFAGFPVAGAALPVIAVLLLGIYSGNVIITGSAIILGIGHIGIHLMHKKSLVN